MSWQFLALLVIGLLLTAGQTWFLADAWSFAVRTNTVWLIAFLAIASMIVVSAQTYLCAILLSIYHDTRKPEGVTPVNREAFASFPYDSTAYLIRQKGTADRPAVGWEVGPSLPYHALSIDGGETPETTLQLDTHVPASFDSHGGIHKEGSAEETGWGTEEEIAKVPSGVHRGKGGSLLRSSYLSPLTEASVKTQKSSGVETPPYTEQSSHEADEDAVTKDIEQDIASRFDLVSSGAATGFQAGLDVVRVSELSDVCAICLGKYSTGERVHVLPCLHIFHEQCLDLWIVSHPSCPYCKGDLNIFPPKCEVSARGETTPVASSAVCCLL